MNIVKNFQEIYNLYVMFLVVGIGLFTFFLERSFLIKKNLKKDAKLAKFIGLSYIIGGPLIYIILMFF